MEWLLLVHEDCQQQPGGDLPPAGGEANWQNVPRPPVKAEIVPRPGSLSRATCNLFKPGNIGALDDGSKDDGEEEDELLQLPAVELDLAEADKIQEDHFFKMAAADRDIPDKIDQSQPEIPDQLKYKSGWLTKKQWALRETKRSAWFDLTDQSLAAGKHP